MRGLPVPAAAGCHRLVRLQGKQVPERRCEMSKRSSVADCDIYVSAERKYSGTDKSPYLYNVFHDGEYEMESLTADEVRELIECLQHALAENEKGVKHE